MRKVQQTDSEAAEIATFLNSKGASPDVVVRTINCMHEDVSYTLVLSRANSHGYAIHRVPEAGFGPSVEVWKRP